MEIERILEECRKPSVLEKNIDICTAALLLKKLPKGGGVRPRVFITERDLEELVAGLDRREHVKQRIRRVAGLIMSTVRERLGDRAPREAVEAEILEWLYSRRT